MFNVEWVAREVLPHERVVRAWLSRNGVGRADQDDLVQEAYARLGRLATTGMIASGRAYFFTTVKNLIRERLRRDRIVRIDLAETQLLCIEDDEPSAERRYSARQQLALVHRFIEELPEPCRSVVRMRKVLGLSQKETASRLGLTENSVEKHSSSAVRKLLKRITAETADTVPLVGRSRGERARTRRGN